MNILLIRAISSEFLRRKLRGVVLVVGVSLIAGFLLMVFMSRYSAWFWIPAILSMLVLFVVGIFYLVTKFAVRLLRPTISAQQTAAVSEFVDKVERVTDYAGTPKILISFYILRDLIRPSEQTFIQKVAHDGTSLRSDLVQLAKEFSV